MATLKYKLTTIISPTPSLAQLRSTLTSLQTATHILAGLTHRNKNQHRGTKWWPTFNMLRRSLQKLILHLEAAIQRAELVPPSNSSSKQQRKTKSTVNINNVKAATKQPELDRAVERVEWMREVLGPKAYEAFTQLTADRQFAQLGLVLIGVLAQVEAAMAPLVPPPAAAEPVSSASEGLREVVDTAAAQGADQHAAAVLKGDGGVVEKAVATTDASGELDLGVAIARDELNVPPDDLKPSVEPNLSSGTRGLPSSENEQQLDSEKSKSKKRKTTQRVECDKPRPDVSGFSLEESGAGEKRKKSQIVARPNTFLEEPKEAKKIKKPKLDEGLLRTVEDDPGTTTLVEPQEVKKFKKKNKKRTKKEGGDEFDDLFSSLL